MITIFDPVERALVEASNALDSCEADFDARDVIDAAIDLALGLIQAEIRAVERELEDAINDEVFDRREVQ